MHLLGGSGSNPVEESLPYGSEPLKWKCDDLDVLTVILIEYNDHHTA